MNDDSACPLCTILHKLGESVDVQVITAYVFGMHGVDMDDDHLCLVHGPVVGELYEAVHDLRVELERALAGDEPLEAGDLPS